ncbi:hypothetical protein [Corynebacterium lubricantis]|uniref:hypothetical protein n=1 Tax=Corynebacterium lubricantis TaxID=541095 RepID=UPI000380BA59|nr:hypothetical protein [Corynebacterium lubricantis]
MDHSSEDRNYYEGSGDYDRETVRFFDVAHEGAQLRAIAGAMDRFASLRGETPRSVVILVTDQIARAGARYVVNQRTPLRYPIVITDALPTFVGALDIVLVVGDVAENDEISQALIAATNRGAAVVLAGPARGPIIDDAPSSVIVIPPLPTSAGGSPMRTIGAVSVLLDSLEDDPHILAQRLDDFANELDEEIQQLSPERDETVNPARQLRYYVSGARVIHTAFRQPGLAVAELVATLWSARGIPSSFVAPEELPRALEEQQQNHDIFYDPFIDSDEQLVPLKAVVWAHDEAPLPNSRAESCPNTDLGDTAAALRLVVRGFATTALGE